MCFICKIDKRTDFLKFDFNKALFHFEAQIPCNRYFLLNFFLILSDFLFFMIFKILMLKTVTGNVTQTILIGRKF